MKMHVDLEAAQGFTVFPKHSEVSFIASSLHSLCNNSVSLKNQLVIAANGDIELDENMKTCSVRN
jgi:hypothetical protein